MKRLQNKILCIFLIVGIIIIVGMGAFFVQILNQSRIVLSEDKYIDSQVLNTIIKVQNNQIKILILGTILVFSCIVIIMGIFIDITVVKPINKIMKDAQKIASGESKELIQVGKTKKKKSEINSIANIIGLMTGEIKQKLYDVKRQKREIETILLHMNDGVLAFDKKGNIMHVNPAAKELMNLNLEKTFNEIFNKIDSNIKMEAIMYLDEWEEFKINIEDKVLNIFLVSYKDENELSSGIIAVIQDITEHAKLDNMRKEFVANVSHELKTPITSIIGYADTLQDGEYDKETRQRFLAVISSEGRRMANLVSDLLTLSRYDTKRIKKEEIEFDLGELTKSCQEKLRIEIERKEQNVECYVTADVPPVKADKNGIERVILNVLSNAIKYTDNRRQYKDICGVCI